MPTSYSSLLRVALQATGENENTWGDIANLNTFEMFEDAIAGIASINITTGNMSLSVANGTIDQARCATLKFTGTPAGAVTVTVPSSAKTYNVHNTSTQSVILTTGTGTTTTFTAGQAGHVYVDGTNVISIAASNMLRSASNLSDLASASTARTNLGLGAVAPLNIGSGLTNNGGNLDVTLSPADTGDVVASYRASKSSWVLLSGGTIGNAASGAVLRANADTSALFDLLWTQCNNTVLPIQNSSGVATTRGASAAADFAANKRLPVPDWRGRSPIGRDDMGGTPANRVTVIFNGTVLGESGGAERHQLTEAELPVHNHTQSYVRGSGSISSGPGLGNGTQDTGDAGSDAPHNNVQPSITVNYFIKL